MIFKARASRFRWSYREPENNTKVTTAPGSNGQLRSLLGSRTTQLIYIFFWHNYFQRPYLEIVRRTSIHSNKKSAVLLMRLPRVQTDNELTRITNDPLRLPLPRIGRFPQQVPRDLSTAERKGTELQLRVLTRWTAPKLTRGTN